MRICDDGISFVVGRCVSVLILVGNLSAECVGDGAGVHSPQNHVTRASGTAMSSVVKNFQDDVAARSAAAEKRGISALEGRDGWSVFVPELHAISSGPFWGPDAAKVSRCANVKYADPLPAIVDFHQQLTAAGIELIVLPVPPKLAVYPEALSETIAFDADLKQFPRLDLYHERFYKVLSEQGVKVIDLWPVFVKARRADRERGFLFCKSDTHWTSRASMLAAQAVFDQVKDRHWLATVPKHEFIRRTGTVEITGDLARMLDPTPAPAERLSVTRVGVAGKTAWKPVGTWRQSPVLVIGDSHTLVFHLPDLYGADAGLPDHLALLFGFPVDLIGVRGSGATATRIALLRRGDNLDGKKLVVWCISARAFTENFAGWRKVPVIR